MIRFACPSCRSVFSVGDDKAGTKAPCPDCGQRLQVPSPSRNRTVLGAPLPPAVPAAGGPDPYTSPPPPRHRQAVVVTPAPGPSAVEVWRPPPRRSRWRFASPSAFALALLLFPLPWVEVRCNGGPGGAETKIAGQSGLQAALGLQSLNPMGEARRSQELEDARRDVRVSGRDEPTAEPLMLLFPLALLAGIALGLVVRPDAARRVSVAVCGGLALLLLLTQIAVGFWHERQFAGLYREMARKNFNDPGTAGATAALSVIRCVYTAWLWLALLAVVAGVALAGAEWALAGARRSARASAAWGPQVIP